MLSIHLRLGLPSGLFPSGFPTNNLYTFLFSPFVPHVPPTSSSSTIYVSCEVFVPHRKHKYRPPRPVRDSFTLLFIFQTIVTAVCSAQSVQLRTHKLVSETSLCRSRAARVTFLRPTDLNIPAARQNRTGTSCLTFFCVRYWGPTYEH
jgi:hypothetical protein